MRLDAPNQLRAQLNPHFAGQIYLTIPADASNEQRTRIKGLLDPVVSASNGDIEFANNDRFETQTGRTEVLLTTPSNGDLGTPNASDHALWDVVHKLGRLFQQGQLPLIRSRFVADLTDTESTAPSQNFPGNGFGSGRVTEEDFRPLQPGLRQPTS